MQSPELSELQIQGMTCASCVGRVERALSKVSGVGSASVNFATERARVLHDPAVADSTLIRAVEDAGYGAAPFILESESLPPSAVRDVGLIVAFALSTPAILISMLWPMRPEWGNWLLFVLTTPVVFWCGRQFFSAAWKSAVHGSANMDTLVALGSGAAWVSSVWGLLSVHGPMQSDYVYFETGSTIVTLILLGRHLENRAKHSMSDAIGKLLDLAPKTAHLLTAGGDEVNVAAASVQVGDVVRIKPGEKAPVDGIVVDGVSYFDESLLTGEPVPVKKGPEDTIVAGSLNGSGSVSYRTTHLLGDSRLAQIARLVEAAQGSKAPVQRLADRVSSFFVPAVILLAAGTFLVRLVGLHESMFAAMIPAIAVLVIACPCALGLATPTAILAGTGRGAQLGILIRDGEVLERVGSLKTLLLDKTGTLTEGHPSVTGVVASPGHDEQSVLQLAGSVEVRSEHPLAKAIVGRCRELGIELLPVAEFDSKPGLGVSGSTSQGLAKVGNPSFVGPSASSVETAGGSVVYVALDGATVGVLSISDPVRPSSKAAVAAIKGLGLTPVMLTGDRESTASSVAAAVGIEKFVAEVLPENKAQVVESYRQLGGVGMVGDGVNDAPALAAADVGIAMGAGSDIAKETAGITLLRNDLLSVPQAISLARRTLQVIRQNLIWAFGYNLVAIPIAMTGRLNPMIAAGAMAFSSISVVLNSLRLKKLG